jgi:hypothetical protein
MIDGRWFQVRFFHEEVGSTMIQRIAVGSSLAIVLLVGGVMAADDLKSGPQPGDRTGGPFNPLNVTNAQKPKAEGTKNCFV